MTADQIAAAMHAEADRLNLAAERIRASALILEGKPSKRLRLVEPESKPEAPYGYKADGTPRKRRPPKGGMAAVARRGWQTRQAAAKAAGQTGSRAERIDLRVLSSTHPTERELADREIGHPTEAPATADGAA